MHAKDLGRDLIQLLGDLLEDQAPYVFHMYWVLGPNHVYSLVGGSDSKSPQGTTLVDSAGLPLGFASPPIPSILLSTFLSVNY